MRPSNYAKKGAIIAALINAALNAIKQLNHINSNSGLKFNWNQLLAATGKGALVGGAIGLSIGKYADYQDAQKEPIDTDKFLYTLASKIRLNKNDRKYLLLCEKADLISRSLNTKFQYKLKSNPIRLGSTEKGTAIKSKFDIDICLAFKPDSFPSLKSMFESVYLFLIENIGMFSINDVKSQRKSIGVFLNIEGEHYKIDVVPYKISRSQRNQTTGYLYRNNTSFLVDNSSYTKTDVYVLNNQKLTETQKRIVLILKHWKTENNLPLSSHLLENLILDAYKYNYAYIPRTFTNKIIMVLRHIADNLDVAVIRSIENTNNILTNISNQNKDQIIDACIHAIEDYNEHTNSIANTFS